MINNDTLNKFLEDGETIRWSGASQPNSIFDSSRKTSTTISLCIAAAWAVISVGAYYASGADIKIGVVLFLLAISAIILWMPISDNLKIKKLLYGITDKNVFVVSPDNAEPIMLPLPNNDEFRIENADNGNYHVKVGVPTFKMSARKLAVSAYRGEYDNDEGRKVYTGLVFFNISAKDGKMAEDLLKQ